MTTSVLCIGELLIDFFCREVDIDLSEGTTFEKQAGGAPANVCATISKLGGRASFCGKIGGDYYDFFKIDKERIGIVIADASGKNVTGAMLMTVFKTALSTMDLSKMTASEALSKANDIVAGNITPDKFVTAMYLIINSKSGEIEMASAGHNPLIIVSPIPKTSRVQTESKNTKGFPLGIMEGFPYPSTRFTIKKGDMIVLYTDGVTEARNVDGHEFGEEKFTQFLTKPRSDNPAQTLTTMIAEFSEGVDKQHDDITAITIEMV